MQASERYPEISNAAAGVVVSTPEPDPMPAAEPVAAHKLGFIMGWELDDLCAADSDDQA